tara:strand:+ start:229 stop:816 length:588 start_codon:yes stop_codon:yes gene_type:complete
MAHNVGQLGADLFKAGKKVSELPTKNVMAMARVTRAEIIASQPKGLKALTYKDVGIKRPRQKNFSAFTFVAGGGLAVIAEHGSYNRPYGWTIYPQAYTVAGGKTTSTNVRYLGRSRIETTQAKLARGSRVSIKDRNRIKRQVLAFGAPNATGFSRKAKHKAIKPGHFVERAAARASSRSGQLVSEQVGKVARSIV